MVSNGPCPSHCAVRSGGGKSGARCERPTLRSPDVRPNQLLDALYAQSARFEDQAQSAKAAASLPDAVQVIRGDFFELVEVVPKHSVDLVVCDPPYGVSDHAWDGNIDLARLWRGLLRVGRRNAVFVIFSMQPFTSRLVLSRPALFKYTLIWAKSTKSNFMAAAHQPLRAHEEIAVFYRAPATYNPLRRKRAAANVPKRLSSTFSSHHGKTIWTGYREPDFGHPTSILRFPSEGNGKARLHPTQKPTALLEYLIRTYSNPGDLVLDPFAGVGTTGAAALRTGRRAILFERDAAFASMAQERVGAASVSFEQG